MERSSSSYFPFCFWKGEKNRGRNRISQNTHRASSCCVKTLIRSIAPHEGTPKNHLAGARSRRRLRTHSSSAQRLTGESDAWWISQKKKAREKKNRCLFFFKLFPSQSSFIMHLFTFFNSFFFFLFLLLSYILTLESAAIRDETTPRISPTNKTLFCGRRRRRRVARTAFFLEAQRE